MPRPTIWSSVVLNDPSLPRIPANTPNLPEFEYDAWGHWIFDTGSSSGLVDRVNGRSLTLQGTAPTYEANHIRVGNLGNALLTGLADSSAWTLCMVAQFTGNDAVFGGTAGGSTGALLNVANGTPDSLVGFAWGPSSTPLTNALVSPAAPPSVGRWIFASMAIGSGSAGKRSVVGLGSSRLITDGAAYQVSGNQIAIGNGYAGFGGTYNTELIRVAEVILFNSGLTVAEQSRIRARSIMGRFGHRRSGLGGVA